MAIYADYTFYTDSYYGSLIPQSAYNYYAAKASAAIADTVSCTIDSVPDAVKAACCEVAEALYNGRGTTDGGGEISSLTIGKYSVSYKAAKTEAENRSEVGEIIRRHLEKTGLLYRGGE